MRDRKATRRRLSVEQETFLLTGTTLIPGLRGETDQDVERRLFTTSEAASEAWHGHRDALLAEYPTAGVRAYGWWVYEHGRSAPPIHLQADVLRELGELSEAEEQELTSWAQTVPEPPDLSIDHAVIDPITSTTITEDTHAEPLEKAGDGSQAVLGERAATDRRGEEGRDAAEAPGEVTPAAWEKEVRPQILFVPWPLQNGNPNEGWESEP
jgi:hypothetical protein